MFKKTIVIICLKNMCFCNKSTFTSLKKTLKIIICMLNRQVRKVPKEIKWSHSECQNYLWFLNTNISFLFISGRIFSSNIFHFFAQRRARIKFKKCPKIFFQLVLLSESKKKRLESSKYFKLGFSLMQ